MDCENFITFESNIIFISDPRSPHNKMWGFSFFAYMENTVIEKIKKGDILILNDDPDLILEIVKHISKIELIEEKAWRDMAQENKGHYLSWRDGFNRPWSWVSEAFRDKGKLFITTLDALDYIRKITTRLE